MLRKGEKCIANSRPSLGAVGPEDRAEVEDADVEKDDQKRRRQGEREISYVRRQCFPENGRQVGSDCPIKGRIRNQAGRQRGGNSVGYVSLRVTGQEHRKPPGNRPEAAANTAKLNGYQTCNKNNGSLPTMNR